MDTEHNMRCSCQETDPHNSPGTAVRDWAPAVRVGSPRRLASSTMLSESGCVEPSAATAATAIT